MSLSRTRTFRGRRSVRSWHAAFGRLGPGMAKAWPALRRRRVARRRTFRPIPHGARGGERTSLCRRGAEPERHLIRSRRATGGDDSLWRTPSGQAPPSMPGQRLPITRSLRSSRVAEPDLVRHDLAERASSAAPTKTSRDMNTAIASNTSEGRGGRRDVKACGPMARSRSALPPLEFAEPARPLVPVLERGIERGVAAGSLLDRLCGLTRRKLPTYLGDRCDMLNGRQCGREEDGPPSRERLTRR
jgi:hypothetical protein